MNIILRYRALLWVVICSFVSNAHGQLWTQDFETNGLGTAYTSPSVFTVNLNGHYNRTNGSNISNTVAPYSNKHGNFIWAGENLNITGGAGDGLPNKTITFPAINVTGQTGLQFRGLFGSGNPEAGWDFDDILYVEYSMNGGPWTKILQFAAATAQSNSGLYHDTDLNGLGEGQALTPALQQFTANIPAAGTSLQLRIYASCTAQSEEFAFDYLRLYSTASVVSGCTNPNASNFNVSATSDNGTCLINGCTNTQALNFNPTATADDGSCVLTVPAVHFNEIHFNPNEFLGFTDLSHEFIEIHNNTSAAINIAGWRISGGVDCTFPIGASIPANGFILAAATPATYIPTGVNVYAYTDDLNNIGENIRLYTNTNILADQVTYSSNCWPASADGNGPSLELINYNYDNNLAISYCAGGQNNGTPGQINSCFTSVIPGCTNPTAANYDENATLDNGSCIIEGCTYPAALNYNAGANSDNGTCLYPQPLPGCTNASALNYNPAATIDNGSCTYPIPLSGCTYSAALNYNANATLDDGSCIYPALIPGCTNITASNYNPDATIDNGTCIYPQPINGCTYSLALNYNASATADDGTCQFPQAIPGCTNQDATNYNALATIDNGSCTYAVPNSGCTYAGALNFDPAATNDDGTCVFGSGIAGCTYAVATNYDAAATIDDGSCLFIALIPGCTNADALNYNSSANVDDGSCVYAQPVLGCTYAIAINYNPSATQDAGNCQFAQTTPGCTNAQAINYNPGATFDDGSCTFPLEIPGCTYPNASNFNILANSDDGTCVFNTTGVVGCTYANALNYDETASIDNGSCTFAQAVPGCTHNTALNYNPAATFDDGSCAYPVILEGCTYTGATNYDSSATSDDGSCLFTTSSTCPEDINNDGFVGVSDLLQFIAAYGNSCN
jgi:hypothetical protein